MTTSLARENRLMDLVQGPAPGYLGAKFGDVIGAFGQVFGKSAKADPLAFPR